MLDAERSGFARGLRVVSGGTWALLAAGVGVALLAAYRPEAARGLLFPWGLANALWAGYLALWGLLHPRVTVPGVPAALRWAFWCALAGGVLGTSAVQMQVASVAVTIPSGFLLLAAVVVFLLALPVAWVWGMCGMALGARLGGDLSPERARAMGLGAWWVVTLAGLALALPGADPAATAGGGALVFGTPCLATLLFRLFQRRGWTLRGLLEAAVARLDRRLIWRRRDGRRLDLRGAGLGAWASLTGLLLWVAGLLAAPSAEALVSGIRFRNEPLTAGGWSLHWLLSPAEQRARDDLVVLRFDPATRYEAHQRTSEAAVQARVITALRRLGVRTIVLPTPQQGGEGNLMLGNAPVVSDAARGRSVRDRPALARAMQEAGNVILARSAATEAPEELRRAARAVATAALEPVGTIRLPAVPLAWEGDPPVALAAAAGALGNPRAVRELPGGRAEAGGRVLRGLRAGRLLVDFVGSGAGLEAPSATYDEVLRGAPLAPAAQFRMQGREGANLDNPWVEPAAFFRGKTVFLDSLTPQLRDTPVGPMSVWEIQAAATATALRGGGLREPAAWAFAAWVLAVGVVTGALCAGLNPVPACWRTAGVALLVGAGSVMALRLGFWLDPVVPGTAAFGALVLATQLNVTEERRQRERNRAMLSRFAPPQVVDELLDDPDFIPGLGGRRQQVAVLFADARGFTSFVERHPPEVVVEVTNAYLSAFTDVVHAHGGILDKYTGDGLMALFLARDTPTAAVHRALRAALDIQAAAQRVSAALGREGEPLVFGIGLHCGDAIVGFVGNPDRLDYTALGHTVVVSQRLQTIALGGEVIVSEAVAGLTGAVGMTAGEPVQVKGLSAAVVPYRLGAEAPGYERL